MEDKWFVCSEGEVKEGEIVTVNFHRSWTGYKMTEIEIEVGKEGEGGRVSGLTYLKGSKNITEEQDLEGEKAGVRELCNWVLGVELGPDG
jgi:hypothetical protein